ncbi:MAG: DUF881 domain-containing protein [Cyanobacteria bacterium]|nr:DUF881 domain-containing protein [Cyanobacteriota bacterium]
MISLKDLQEIGFISVGKQSIFFGFMLGMFIILSILASFYWTSSIKEMPRRAFSTQEIARTNQLNRMLRRAETQNSNLESEIALLSYESIQNSKHPKVQNRFKPDPRVDALVGNTLTTGTGLTITLQDNKKPVYFGPSHLIENPNLGIVHNVDLILMVNQLWANGASAISINQERIVANTDISCAGPVIMVNKTRITSPFVIQVMGKKTSSPEKLYDFLQSQKSYLHYLSSYGIPSEVEIKNVTIPAYNAAL